MIAKEFELLLLEQEETFLTSAENLAVLIFPKGFLLEIFFSILKIFIHKFGSDF